MALLEVCNITKRFGGLEAVKNLDLTIEEGEILGVIGPNGAGKTTAFNVISGFYKPDEGKIFFNGEDITGLRPDQICKRGLTRTFQVVKPFSGINVLDNVIVGTFNHTNDMKMAREKAEKVLEFLHMRQLADQMAGGQPIGIRKRLEIAKALATEPKMILLDETMAGLRPSETEETIQLVRKIRDSGCSLLLVEHVMKVIMSLADRIVVIHHGEKIAEGIPREIVRNEAVIEAYLGEEISDVEY